MKNILSIFVLLALLSSCATNSTQEEVKSEQESTTETSEDNSSNKYGEPLEEGAAFSLQEMVLLVNEEGRFSGNVSGVINQTCPKKGCWMTLDNEGGEEIRVTFKDYGFFVPTEGQEGKTAVMSGNAVFDTLSVDLLRHYAEDAGKSQEEIDAITEPEISIAFVATGVEIE